MTEYTAECCLLLIVATIVALNGIGLYRLNHHPACCSPRITIELGGLSGLVFVTMVVAPLLHIIAPLPDALWIKYIELPFRDIAGWIGLGLGSLAIWTFWRAGHDWCRYFREGEIIDKGIYHHLRHPFYSAILLWSLAQVLLLQNWLSGVLALATFGIIYLMRVPEEELQRIEQYGYRYVKYMERTGDILPNASWRK